MDRDGYGPRPHQSEIERLLEDARTLSPAGVERVAAGWDKRGDDEAFHHAEQAALRAIEHEQRGIEWDALRNELLGLTERGQPLVAWRAEHGDVGHKAENALLAAAMAITAGPDLDSHSRETLRRPIAAALPWVVGPPATMT